ncbi:MAG TPA: PaaI family thioesterase [Solirubrobacteraceae bacterium]|nr:PaaI family thioesterase [Solirubrobacteraceae bacterium]
MAEAQPVHNEPLPGFDGHIGLEYLSVGSDEMRARVAVRPHHLQPFGLVHGGVYAAVAESMASYGTAVGAGEGKFVAGMSNSTTFLRPLRDGTIHALAVPRHTGRTTWIWDVDLTGDDGRPVATSRVTIAVREAR